MEVASTLGFAPRAVRCEVSELSDLTLPAILHWDLNHFVVLSRVGSTHLVIDDPASGRTKVPIVEASRRFTGVALELEETREFKKRRMRPLLSATALITWTRPVVMGLLQALLLSLVLQAYVLAAPFYMQMAIDEAALKGDLALLNVLAMGFGLFALFNVCALLLRGFATQRVVALLGWGMTTSLYRHLLSLPLRWFQRRRLADTLVRFESIEPIRQLVANNLVTSLLDGVLSISIIVLMFIFSWKLTAIAVAALIFHLIVRWSTISVSLRLASEELSARIAEEGKRIETVKAIQTIKATASEGERERDWKSQFAQVIRTSQRNALFKTSLEAVQQFIELIAYVLIVYVAVREVMSATLSVGAVFAFVAYRQQFHQLAVALSDVIINWRLLDLHTDRLADIVLEKPEEPAASPTAEDIEGKIEIQGVSFRYSPSEPFVIRPVNLEIATGQFVAFVGASGQGKTTLMKVVSGLYPASSGEVRIDGRPLSFWGPQKVRRSIGMVLQDDELLSGTIIENVTLFDENPDVEWAWKCLKSAAVDDEVAAMPMSIDTFVGDMGAALSGGQKQRVLLARALYRRPKILILDEATSHLDRENERTVSDALDKLAITRLVVAHRRETIARADKIVSLENGQCTVFYPAARRSDE
jgi:ATP-binding cassette subfamily B protein RaxB